MTLPNFRPENQSRSRRFHSTTMSLRTSKTTRTYRTVKAVSPVSPEPVTSTLVSTRSASPLPYTVNGYETLRYLVPMQQQQPQQQFVLMQQPMVQQQMVQQVMTPVYLQNLQSLQHLSVSNHQDTELLYLQQGAAGVSTSPQTINPVQEVRLEGKQSDSRPSLYVRVSGWELSPGKPGIW